VKMTDGGERGPGDREALGDDDPARLGDHTDADEFGALVRAATSPYCGSPKTYRLPSPPPT
jgi:hypothetical protein